jgi:hypothetical protein
VEPVAAADPLNERPGGHTMVRTLIKLAIVVLVVHAAVKTVPHFWAYAKFRDKVQEMARFSSRRTDQDVLERVVKLAQQFDLPITPADVKVRKQQTTTFVETRYTVQLEYFPSRFYPWTFELRVEGVPPVYETIP